MCGINGIYAYKASAPAPSREELVKTRDYMRSRGPDGEGLWSSAGARCLLGHRRLAIIDLSERAVQPMAVDNGNCVVTYNGEIYNYAQLRWELEADGVRFRTTSDTEVLLHLYARDGEDMLPRLRGMFAFAIWDAAKRGLFLARDPYGIKPLYTADNGGTFRFASQVKALLAGQAISRERDPAGLVGFYLFGSVPEPFTLCRSVGMLPAGNSQWVDENGAQEPRRYHNIAHSFTEVATEQSKLEVELRSAVLDSVRAHLIADVPVGLFLSAGIDSGALLGLMRAAGQRDVLAITLGFEEFSGTAEDEVPLARQVAQRYGAQHVVRLVSEQEFKSDFANIMAAMDQPSIDGINGWFVAKAAREAGLKVALSGLGSDELLAGYPSFKDVPRWKKRYGPLARVPGAGAIFQRVAETIKPGFRRTRPKASGLLYHAGTWGGAYLLRRGLFLPHELPSILGTAIARDGLERLAPIAAFEQALIPDPGSDYARVSVLESSFYMRNQLLRDTDWAGMAHGVEVRLPFVDAHLLRTLAPYVHNLTRDSGKRALAHAPEPSLPSYVVERPKSGFGVPTRNWLRSSNAELGRGQKGTDSRRWAHVVLEGALSQ